jgi:hypothetical protein
VRASAEDPGTAVDARRFDGAPRDRGATS